MVFQFSNFQRFDSPLIYQGMEFHTVENFYMAMKTLDVSDRRRISLMSPADAKKAGKKLTLREDWDTVKERVMRYALDHKFQAGTSHAAKLVLTKGEIVEHNTWHDNFWGTCWCQLFSGPAPYGARYTCRGGKNLLGKMLMEIRNNLIQEQQ